MFNVPTEINFKIKVTRAASRDEKVKNEACVSAPRLDLTESPNSSLLFSPRCSVSVFSESESVPAAEFDSRLVSGVATSSKEKQNQNKATGHWQCDGATNFKWPLEVLRPKKHFPIDRNTKIKASDG